MARHRITPIDDTFNHTLPPYGSEAQRTIIFALTKYYVPEGAPDTYAQLYSALSTAVSERDVIKLHAALERLAPYKIRSVAKKQYKQTEVRNVKDFGTN